MQMLFRYAELKSTFRQRKAEWLLATAMLLFGLNILWPMELFDKSGYQIIRVVISEDFLGWALVFGGALRIAVLALNGVYWQMYGARSWMALSSMVVWLLLALGFVEAGSVGLATAVLPVFVVFDFSNAMQAAEDAADRRLQLRRERSATSTGQAVNHSAA